MDLNHYELALLQIIPIRCTDDYPLPTLPICLPMQYQYVSLTRQIGFEPMSQELPDVLTVDLLFGTTSKLLTKMSYMFQWYI